MIILALSFLAADETRVCPKASRAGTPLSAQQQDMCDRVYASVLDWLRPPFLKGGRGEKKVRHLSRLACELAQASLGAVVTPDRALAASPFVASRARLMSEPLHFDCTQYLPVFEAATFLEPRLLQRSEPFQCSAFRAACKRNPEVLAFARDWDKFDKLTLIPQAQAFEPSPLLATWKTDEMDRTLFDRRRRNASEHRIEGASAQMSTGAQLLDMQAGPGQELVGCVDDLKDHVP